MNWYTSAFGLLLLMLIYWAEALVVASKENELKVNAD